MEQGGGFQAEHTGLAELKRQIIVQGKLRQLKALWVSSGKGEEIKKNCLEISESP